MEVSIWVPIAVAVIAALGTYMAARTPRGTSETERKNKEMELALEGLVALLDQVQEERLECRRELERVLGILRKRDRSKVVAP